MRACLAVMAVVVGLTLVSCSHVTGKYEEVGQKYEQITGIDSLRITVKAQQTKFRVWESRLADQIAGFVKKEKIFKSVTIVAANEPKRKIASAKDLSRSLDAVVYLEEVSDGNSATRFMVGTGEAVAKATVIVKRSENGQEFSRFKVVGNSAHKSQTSVNGVNVTRLNGLSEDLPARALVAIAEHFTEYFSDKISH